MKVIILMINLKDMENIFGKMIIIIQFSLKMDAVMEEEYNIIVMEKFNMMVLLLTTMDKDMDYIYGKMSTIIQVNLKKV